MMRRKYHNRKPSMTVGKRTTEAGLLLQLLTKELEPAEQYLKSFHWNKVKYRADKPLGEIVVTLQKVAGSTVTNEGTPSEY